MDKTKFTPEMINELKGFYVERVVDNMDVKDLVNYVMDDLDRYYENRSDEDFLEDAICYDLSYGPAASFSRWAESSGAKRSIDGLGMLIEQAAKSYEIWTGFSPNTESVRAKIRNDLGV